MEPKNENENEADVIVPHPHGEAGLRIKVLDHPEDVFYKDEGGKSNHLLTSICVENLGNAKQPQFGKVWVLPKLCYENGKEVEDGADIFKVLSLEPEFVTSSDQKVTVKFRIEKVSRRKDGQRFKVRFTADPAKSPPAVASTFTSAVCVLSKRKFPASQAGKSAAQQKRANIKRSKTTGAPAPAASSPAPSTRRASLPATKSDLAMEAMQAMRKTIAALEAKVDSLTDRVKTLEGEQGVLRDGLKRSRQELQENLRLSTAPLQPDFNMGKFRLDCDDSEVLSDLADEDLEPYTAINVKPTAMDVTFNWGLPSSVLTDSPSPY